MKGTAINTLNYTGTVHLSLLVDAKTKVPFATIHNAGTSALFNFFTDCLVGDFVKAGQVLFEIEPQEYEYAASKAKGDTSTILTKKEIDKL